MPRTFTGNFTQQEALPEAAIEAAIAVMRSGRLHRYNVASGEKGETALLEKEFAASLGVPYCLATGSGGTAMQIALSACGLERGAPVLTNAFTLSPVPGAIHVAGGKPVLVETTDNMTIDLADLTTKAAANPGAVLMLSHMRGHLADMDEVVTICTANNLTLIEDCAHTMGGAWRGKPSGTFGKAGCFSTQTYKHVNSGEGGFLTTDDADLMARATIRSGSYMLHDRHAAGPDASAYADARLDMPNGSSRMDNLRAAILRPQLAALSQQVERWNARYRAIEDVLRTIPGVATRDIPQAETHVGSSIQFRAPALTDAQVSDFLALTASRGVELKWFGAPQPHGYTSNHSSWRYVEAQAMPETDRILSRLFDMRLPLTFSVDDCRLIGEIIGECMSEIS